MLNDEIIEKIEENLPLSKSIQLNRFELMDLSD